jgi:molybdenum cofactor cytidylyltransferase
MTPGFSTCGVILAAGESTRMGKDKAQLPWPPQATTSEGGTFLSSAIQALMPFNDLVLVVAGKNAPSLAPIINTCGAVVVINPAPERGQFSSLQCGLREAISRGCAAAMVTLVDRPPAQPSTLEKLRTTLYSALSREKWAVVPEYCGRHGHPILVSREMVEVFLKAPSSARARDVLHQHQMRIDYLPVDDPFVAANVDTPDEYSNLSQFFQNSR